ncbi:MAG: CDP-4-keto-6-deoxy-D-glucose-3-dehydrase [Pelagibacteraceae bacterium TMED201]|nr:MAG: CDP-4-keto-6-deoxy-D-glucose-3-dehydrase [Pelagibacteraceae bacterium TMED201]
MSNNILRSDKKVLVNFINRSNKFTNGPKVKEFENRWSKWLGVKYSTFVNSGASANLISIHILKELNKKKKEIILPAFTWNSDVVSVINAGFKPVFIDINFENLALNENLVKKKINKNTFAIFLTHAMGYIGLSNKFLKFIKNKNIYLIEDVCESHGAKLGSKKAGTLGEISNFSFYYGHHMTTIEGGMISTNSKEVDRLAKMKRGHGLLRDSQDKYFIRKTIKKYKNLNNDFIFNTEGFNFRNTEIAAVLGIEQLKRLNKSIKKRNENHKLYLKLLRGDIFFKDFNLKGSSNYGLHLILKKKNSKLFKKILTILDKNSVEYRLGSLGNQLRQPYLKRLVNKKRIISLKNTEHMHFFSVYFGNNQFLDQNKIRKLCKDLNSLVI